jgi:hypothetical protein
MSALKLFASKKVSPLNRKIIRDHFNDKKKLFGFFRILHPLGVKNFAIHIKSVNYCIVPLMVWKNERKRTYQLGQFGKHGKHKW